VRIFDAVEHDEKRKLSALGCDHILEFIVLFRRSDGDDTLMRVVAGHTIEFGAAYHPDRDTLLAALFDHALHADIVAIFGDADP